MITSYFVVFGALSQMVKSEVHPMSRFGYTGGTSI